MTSSKSTDPCSLTGGKKKGKEKKGHQGKKKKKRGGGGIEAVATRSPDRRPFPHGFGVALVGKRGSEEGGKKEGSGIKRKKKGEKHEKSPRHASPALHDEGPACNFLQIAGESQKKKGSIAELGERCFLFAGLRPIVRSRSSCLLDFKGEENEGKRKKEKSTGEGKKKKKGGREGPDQP